MLSLQSAAAIDLLVEGLRRQVAEFKREIDLTRKQSRRLYSENIELAAQVRRLEAEKRRLVEQLEAALLPRSK